MTKRKCKFIVKDKVTKKRRLCRKNSVNGLSYCSIHNQMESIDSHSQKDNYEDFMSEFGKCCFCGDDCNPLSQSCGRCARVVSWFGIDYLNSQLQLS